jgi:tetratricopeptide (TPR) repeat protein
MRGRILASIRMWQSGRAAGIFGPFRRHQLTDHCRPVTAEDQTIPEKSKTAPEQHRTPPVMTPDEAYRAARRAEKKKRPDVAEKLYRKILAANPEHGKSAHALALLVLRSERMDEAVDLFRKAARLQPDNPFVHYNFALVFEHQEKYYEAEMAVRRALSLDRKAWKLHRKLGALLFRQERYKDAAQAFSAGLELSPGNVGLIGQIGLSYHLAQEYALAEIHYRRVLAMRPDHFDVLLNFGIALVEQDRAEEAAALLSQAVARQKDHPKALARYARALQELEQPDKARSLYERCLESNPENVDALYGLSSLIELERDDARLATLRQLDEREEDPKSLAYIRTALGNAMHRLGEYDAAFDYYEQANRTRAVKRFEPLPARMTCHEIVSVFDAAMLARTCRQEREYRTPIFVVGTPRSGKSLVEKLLKCHPEVAGLGENKALTSAFKDMVEEAGLELDYPNLVRQLSDDQIAAVGEGFLDLTRDIDPGKRFIVNTLPAHVRFLGLIAMALPGAKLVAIERDAMDVCVQMFCKHFAHGNEYALDLGHLGAFIAQHRFVMQHWRRMLGERLLCIRYESLVTDTEANWAALADHCGLPAAPLDLPRPTTEYIGFARHYARHLQPLELALQAEERELSKAIRRP